MVLQKPIATLTLVGITKLIEKLDNLEYSLSHASALSALAKFGCLAYRFSSTTAFFD